MFTEAHGKVAFMSPIFPPDLRAFFFVNFENLWLKNPEITRWLEWDFLVGCCLTKVWVWPSLSQISPFMGMSHKSRRIAWALHSDSIMSRPLYFLHIQTKEFLAKFTRGRCKEYNCALPKWESPEWRGRGNHLKFVAMVFPCRNIPRGKALREQCTRAEKVFLLF